MITTGADAVFTMLRSTMIAPVVPPLPLLSMLFALFGSNSFAVFGSNSVAVAVALLSNAPTAVIVAATLMVVFAPLTRLAIVQGSAAQPLPLTLVIVRFVGVSVT